MAQIDDEYEDLAKQGRIWGSIARDRIKKLKFPRYSKEIRERFLAIADVTSVVSDILDAMGIRGVVASQHIAPVIPGRKIAGAAVTQRSIPSRKATVRGYIDKDTPAMCAYDGYFLSEPYDVLVADFGGCLDISNQGGNACNAGKACGGSGSIVYGAVRDAESIRAIDFPVWSSAVTPITGKFRLETIEINGPVTVHDVVVYPGDLALADDSGVAFVPPEHVSSVLEAAEVADRRGEEFQAKLRSKIPREELREWFLANYHKK